MKNKKQILIILGAVVLLGVLALFLRNIGAGKSQEHPHTIISTAEFNHWFGEGGTLSETESETYYIKLWSNIRLTETARISNCNTVILDLNGHQIQSNKQIQAFSVTGEASLSLLNGTVSTAGANANGGVILVDGNSCNLDLTDMTLTNTGDADIDQRLSGGVLYISTPKTATENPAILTISGNTVITGSSSGKRHAGGSIATKGFCEIHMYSGSVQSGTASSGGNIFLADRSRFYMHDGQISGGQALGKSATTGLGGNVDLRGSSRFSLIGGTVTGGYAQTNGGNIFLSNYGELGAENGLYVYAGAIEDGTADKAGGNIFASDKDSFIRMFGGQINSGTCTDGGNVYLLSANLLMRGGVLTGLRNNTKNTNGGNVFSDHGTITLYDGTIRNAMANGCGGNIFLTDGRMDMYGGTVSGGCLASYDVSVGGGNIYAKGNSVINLYGGLINKGRTNYDNVSTVSAAGGNVMIADKSFMQMFGGEISDGIIGGSISRGGSVYVYGQPRGAKPVFHMYGGMIRNGETSGTMRGMAIGSYSETGRTKDDKTGTATARIFGGIIHFSGPYNSGSKRYTLYTNRTDLESLRIYDDSGMQLLNVGATVGACPDASHDIVIEEIPATCITPGMSRYHCNTCGDWYRINEKALGHYNIEAESATLDGKEGWLQYTCESCGTWYRNPNEPTEEDPDTPKYTVQEPLVYPNYTFTDTPDTAQLRQTAVQAARDLLSVQWCAPNGLGYYKTGSKKYFEYPKGMTFGGLMYSGASSGLFQFLEYYNFETGEFVYPGLTDKMKTEIGSACTDSLLWSWSTVCNSFSCAYYPSTLVQKNGFLTVGEYTYDPSISTYYQLSTKTIVENNGNAVMNRSYAQMLPADILVSSTADHSLMVIEAPHIVMADDGTINAAESYVMIQDQRGGIGNRFYEVYHEDYTVYHSGRISQKFTFEELLKDNYIPMTAPEFVGKKPYEAPEVTVEGGPAKTFADIRNLEIHSNYPIAVINIYGESDGKSVNLDKILFNGLSDKGVPRSYALSMSEGLQDTKLADFTSIRVVVTTSTGKQFTPIEITAG